MTKLTDDERKLKRAEAGDKFPLYFLPHQGGQDRERRQCGKARDAIHVEHSPQNVSAPARSWLPPGCRIEGQPPHCGTY